MLDLNTTSDFSDTRAELTYKEVTDYENFLIRFYHSYLSCNYAAELLNIALKKLPEDAPVNLLAEMAGEYQVVSELAKDASCAWMELFLNMQEGVKPPDASRMWLYEQAKQSMAASIGEIWLMISETFSTEVHDTILEELDYNLSTQNPDVEEQYDLVLTGQYPTMPENVRQVITSLKVRAHEHIISETQQITATAQ